MPFALMLLSTIFSSTGCTLVVGLLHHTTSESLPEIKIEIIKTKTQQPKNQNKSNKQDVMRQQQAHVTGVTDNTTNT